MANQLGGQFLIRIEDIDRQRCTPELAAQAIDDLASIGLRSDGPVLYQSQRYPLYRDALAKLKAMGLIYSAGLSRAELRGRVEEYERSGAPWPRDPDGAPHYPTEERDAFRQGLPPTGKEAFAARLDLEAALARIDNPITWTEIDEDGANPRVIEADPTAWGDPVIWRRDGVPAYHLAVTVDDAAQGITHIVRGTDLRESTSLHRVLQHLLGLPEPLYHHHELVRGAEGHKLSKSAGDGLRRPLTDEPRAG